jgi:hypothetical protein
MPRWEQRTFRRKRRHYAVQVSSELHARVHAEATRRGWTMTRLVDVAFAEVVPEVSTL